MKETEQTETERLSHGEFYMPTGSSRPEFVARFHFLSAIETLAPNVITEIAENIFPKYETALNSLQLGHPALENPYALQWASISTPSGPAWFAEAEPLIRSIEAWCNRYHVNASWMKDCIMSTLAHWRFALHKPGDKFKYSLDIDGGSTRRVEIPFRCDDRHWSIEGETEAGFRRRVSAQFRTYLNYYIEQVSTRAEREGFQRTPKLNAGKWKDSHRDFRLLVTQRVLGWKRREIMQHARSEARNRASSSAGRDLASAKAKTYLGDQKSLSAALERAAKLLDFEPYHAPRGRPRTARQR